MEIFISDTIVSARAEEPLEKELRVRGLLGKQQERLHNALRQLEETQIDKTAFEEAYRLGVRDGIEIGKEQKEDRDKTILSYKDMVIAIQIYEAVKKLSITMLGELTIHGADEGVLGTLEMICFIIEHGVCEELKLLGDDEVVERILSILNDTSTASEKAKKLLGMDR